MTTQHPPKNKWLGLIALMPSVAMVFTDQSILPVALPTIQSHLGATHTALWWCINAYLLVSAVLLLVGGKIGDRIGHRKAYLSGISIFTVASALCGLSYDIYMLIFARGLQGVGAALLLPASSVLLMNLFPQKERGKAIGISVSVSSLFLIFAPMIGGYLTTAVSWRAIFWINIPLALLGIYLVLRHIPNSLKGKQHLDPWGFLAFLVSTTCLTVVLMQGEEWGWSSVQSYALLAVFILSGLYLVWRERHASDPFLEVNLFRHPIYRAVNISIFAVQFVMMISVYRVMFFQEVMGWTPIKSGMIFTLTSTPVLFLSPIGGWLADRFSPKLPIAIGFMLLIYSFFWVAFHVESSIPTLLIGFFAFGVGIPLVFTPSYSSAMGAIPQKKAGVAFGILSTTRSLSATFGVAAISAMAAYLKSSYLEQHSVQLIGNEALKASQLYSFFYLHLMMGCLLILAFGLVFVLYHRKPSHHLPETPAEGWD